MSKPDEYNWNNIRILLLEGFSESEILRFCHDTSGFKPFFRQLAQNLNREAIIDELILYAERKLLVEKLLAWAKENNYARYKTHKPYRIFYNPNANYQKYGNPLTQVNSHLLAVAIFIISLIIILLGFCILASIWLGPGIERFWTYVISDDNYTPTSISVSSPTQPSTVPLTLTYTSTSEPEPTKTNTLSPTQSPTSTPKPTVTWTPTYTPEPAPTWTSTHTPKPRLTPTETSITITPEVTNTLTGEPTATPRIFIVTSTPSPIFYQLGLKLRQDCNNLIKVLGPNNPNAGRVLVPNGVVSGEVFAFSGDRVYHRLTQLERLIEPEQLQPLATFLGADQNELKSHIEYDDSFLKNVRFNIQIEAPNAGANSTQGGEGDIWILNPKQGESYEIKVSVQGIRVNPVTFTAEVGDGPACTP